MVFMTQLTLYSDVQQKRLNQIYDITVQKQCAIHTLLDNSYVNTQKSLCTLTHIFKKNIMFNKLKSTVRESEFLKKLNEHKRNDPYILRSIIDIINSKDSTGTTPIMKTINNDDVDNNNNIYFAVMHYLNDYLNPSYYSIYYLDNNYLLLDFCQVS